MDVDTDGLPTDDVIAIPVPSPEDRPAYFAVTAATHVARPRAEQRQVAALLAHLAAGSLALEAGAFEDRPAGTHGAGARISWTELSDLERVSPR